MKKAALFLIPLALLGAPGVEARMDQAVDLAPEAQAHITLGCCFDNAALAGYAPIDVTINNHSGQARRWVLEFSSPGFAYGAANRIQSNFTVTVENNGTRTVPLLVPTLMGPSFAQMPMGVKITGYGAENTVQQMLGARSVSGKAETRFIAISDSLGTSIWSSLSGRLGRDGRDLCGSTFNPTSCRRIGAGLSGVAALLLSGDELNHLGPVQREAIATWVHTGGLLMICRATQAPEDFLFAGFGQVRVMPAALDIDHTAETIEGLPASSGPVFGESTTHTSQFDNLPGLTPNVPLLGGFMALFALVVGPVNVFAIAPRRRVRLLWTTPLISIGASVLLVGLIFLQDGVGGRGNRRAVVCLFPQSREAVVVQEQISRTGVLLDSAFQTRDPLWIEQSVEIPANQGRTLGCDGNSYGKDWFASRAMQTQRLVAVTPTRAEITIVNGPDVAAKGAAPVVVSSFDATLDELYYTDNQNRRWHGSNVRTGQRQPLHLISKDVPKPRPPNCMTNSLRDFSMRPGSFWATAGHSGDYVETLRSIHWTDEPITYAGPVTD